MADITMCKGDGCETKFTCFRFCAIPNERQSFFTNSPIKDGSCEYYWQKKY